MEHVLTESTPKPTRSQPAPKPSFADRLQHWLPKIVLAPTALVTVVCIYGYIFGRLHCRSLTLDFCRALISLV